MSHPNIQGSSRMLFLLKICRCQVKVEFFPSHILSFLPHVKHSKIHFICKQYACNGIWSSDIICWVYQGHILRTLFVHLRTIFVHFEAAAAAAYQPPRPQPKFSRSNIVTRHWLKILGWVQICWLGVATQAQRWQFGAVAHAFCATAPNCHFGAAASAAYRGF